MRTRCETPTNREETIKKRVPFPYLFLPVMTGTAAEHEAFQAMIFDTANGKISLFDEG